MGRLPDVKTLRHLIWVQTGFIGDVVLTTAALALAKRQFPDATQLVVTTPIGALALAGANHLAECVVFDKKAGALAAFAAVRAALAAKGVEFAAGPRATALVLAAHRSHRTSFLCHYLGLPWTAFDDAGASWLATKRVARVATLHEAARIGLLLEPLGVLRLDIVAARLELTSLPLDADVDWAKTLQSHRGPVFALAPGSVWGTKRWPAASYAALMDQLTAAVPHALLLLIGSEAEKPVVTEVMAAVASKTQGNVVNLAGRTTLEDLRRIMPRLSLLVANDSSPVHFASSFAVPTVTIFGPTVPGMGFGPLAPRSVAIGTELSCRPCSDHGPQTCPLGHFRCMRDLAPEAVLAACIALVPEHFT